MLRDLKVIGSVDVEGKKETWKFAKKILGKYGHGLCNIEDPYYMKCAVPSGCNKLDFQKRLTSLHISMTEIVFSKRIVSTFR